MEYRLDKSSGNMLSVLGFGCMRLPRSMGLIDMHKTEEMILKAVEGGVNYFDTAYIYPGSEETLGKVLEKNGLRQKVFIATKLPLLLLKGPDFDKFFDKQLERLKTDYIDYYLLHMLTDTEFWNRLSAWGIEDWLAKKLESGQIRKIGFSFHGSKDEFLKLLEVYGWDFCQIQYNYLNETYQAGTEGLKKAYDKGMSVIIMEPLLGGKLAGGLPKGAVDAFKEADGKLTPAAWALKWLWNREEPTVVLSGMSAVSDVSDNLSAARGSHPGMFGERELKAFEKVIKEVNSSYKIMCTGCGYCMPCPKNVNIPACFQAYNTSFAHGRRHGIQQYITSTGGPAGVSSAASNCAGCGRCEKHCPQGIKITEELSSVKKRMEPFWFRAAMSAARAVLGASKK